MAKRVVLAYSGGLDTSVAVRWLIENEGAEVIAVAVDVGQNADADEADWDAIRERALAAGADITVTHDAREAASGADAVITDTWVSMGDTDREARMQALGPFQVDAALMKLAKADALFFHDLPAHRGEEVTAEVIDGPQSVIWDEAENRIHAQKSIIAWCLGAI